LIIVNNKYPVQILSSSSDRGRESAEILASVLEIEDIETFDYLWSGGDSPLKPAGDIPKVHKLVSERREQATGIIIVTHSEITDNYPKHFTKQEFGKFLYFDKIPRGEAYSLDLKAKEWKLLPSGIIVHKI